MTSSCISASNDCGDTSALAVDVKALQHLVAILLCQLAVTHPRCRSLADGYAAELDFGSPRAWQRLLTRALVEPRAETGGSGSERAPRRALPQLSPAHWAARQLLGDRNAVAASAALESAFDRRTRGFELDELVVVGDGVLRPLHFLTSLVRFS